MGKKRSDIWNHFTPSDDDTRGICHYCRKHVSVCGGSVSNLSRHLKQKHSKICLERLLSGALVSFASDGQDQNHNGESHLAPVTADTPVILASGETIEAVDVTEELVGQVFLKKPAAAPKGKRKSDVWNHFTKYHNSDGNKKIGQCHYCHKLVSVSGGNSNLRRHLEKKHPKVDITSKGPNDPGQLAVESGELMGQPDPLELHDQSELQAIEEDDQESHEQGNSPSSTPSSTFNISGEPGDGSGKSDEFNAGNSSTATPNLHQNKRSAVWDHFIPDDSLLKGKCRYCDKAVSTSGGSISNLSRHLQRKHPKVRIRRTTYGALKRVGNTPTKPTPREKLTSDNYQPKPIAGRKKSYIWNHFSVLANADNSKVLGKCNVCHKVVNISSGCVSNLRRHLKKKHPNSFRRGTHIGAAQPTNTGGDNMQAAGSNVELNSLPSEEIEVTYCEAYSAQPATSANPVVPRLGAPVTNLTSIRTLPLQSFANIRKPITGNKKKLLDENLVRLICKGFHPISSFLDGRFRAFLTMLNPDYELISIDDFKNILLSNTFKETKIELQKKLKDTSAVCLSVEGWRTSKNKCFVALTAHYLLNGSNGQDLQSYSSVLSCSQFFEPHSPHNISRWLQDTVLEWTFQDKVTGIITNYSPDLFAAVENCTWIRNHVPCFAHALNASIEKGLQEVNDVIWKVRTVVHDIRGSAETESNFYDIQKQLGLPKLPLKKDHPSVWTTTIKMLDRFLQNKICILPTLTLSGYIEEGNNYFDNVWPIIDSVNKILKLFDEVVTDISAEETISSSRIPILLRVIIRRLNMLTDLPAEVERLRNVILQDLNVTYNVNNLEKHSLIGQAVVLDPRFKREGISNEENFSFIKSTLMEELTAMDLPVILPNMLQSSAPSAPIQSSALWDEFDEAVKKTAEQTGLPLGSVAELEQYLAEPLIPRSMNPLIWWNNRKAVYPSLYKLVLRKLCTPASAVPFQRMFTKEGFVSTERRGQLNSSRLVPLIVFLNQNM